MSKVTDEVMGHADENDGIEEYDNPLPDWWIGLFLFTIVWGIGYGIDFHFISHRSQADWYGAEMARAAEQYPDLNKVAAVSMAPEDIAEGEKIYTANCVGCHMADLSGSIGPNLVDAEWIHGGEPEDIMRVITEGVPAKGMVTWGPILGPKKISQVTAYILHKGGHEG